MSLKMFSEMTEIERLCVYLWTLDKEECHLFVGQNKAMQVAIWDKVTTGVADYPKEVMLHAKSSKSRLSLLHFKCTLAIQFHVCKL